MKKIRCIGKRVLVLVLIFVMSAEMSVTTLSAAYNPTFTKPKIITAKPNVWVTYKVFNGAFNSNGKNTSLNYKVKVPSDGTLTFTLKKVGTVWADLFILKKSYDFSFSGVDLVEDIPGYVDSVSLGGKSSRTVTLSLKKGTYYLGGQAILKFKYTFRPDTTKITRLKNTSSRKLYVNWVKKANVTGYQIQYSTSSKFSSSRTKAVTIKKAANSSGTISKLTKGKTYYVRVRTYNNMNGKNYYSKWSAAKKVKITR